MGTGTERGVVARSPGDYIREELRDRGWTQQDLARILGRPLPTVNRILQGKHAVLPEMAIALGLAFGNDPELWMKRETEYRLSLATFDGGDVRRRARLHDIAPVSELQRRGWLSKTTDELELEKEILALLEIDSLDDEPHLLGALRKTNPYSEVSAAQRAWWFRVRQIARKVSANTFDPTRLAACESELRKLAAFPQEARKVPGVLAEYGIRLVVVEPLSGAKVDGVAMWLDATSPVIGMSLHRDRMDSFWFTLCHELSHIRHRDEASFDADLSGHDPLQLAVRAGMERRADAEAAAMLVEPQVLSSFVKRVAPLYSKQRIIQLANRIKIHPGIIVGQLQHLGEVGWNAHRGFLVKVRDFVVPVSATDGWGRCGFSYLGTPQE